MRWGWKVGALGAAWLVAGSLGGVASAQQARPAPPPLPYPVLRTLHDDPAAWQRFLAGHSRVPTARIAAPKAPAALPAWQLAWTTSALSNPLLLTDGTVMAHLSCSRTWFRLTPDINGSYAAGTWKATAPMPAGYAPRFFSSAVLPDGRVVVEGGEYNGTNCDDVETTKGAIYDPQTNTWTAIAPPTGWKTIGDASGIVLADGVYLLSDCCTTHLATLNPTTLAWTAVAATDKVDINNEENWTLLPGGGVLTVDAYTYGPTGATIPCGAGSQRYLPGSATWVDAGSTIYRLAGCSGAVADYEAPTQILRPNGTVAAFGSTAGLPSQNLPVHTAVYSVNSGKWWAGPNMPKVGGIYYTMADAPAAVLADGTVLIAASPTTWTNASSGGYPPPTHFFNFTGAAFAQLGDVDDSPDLSSFEVNFLVLPTGEILEMETDYTNSEILPAVCCAADAWAPTITSISATTLAAGGSYTLKGTQLSGRTQGATYGDDAQADTNFPLVRITNTATSHVFYARTTGFLRSVAPGAASSTEFAVPAAIETGAGTLEVVANGIASHAMPVTITAQ